MEADNVPETFEYDREGDARAREVVLVAMPFASFFHPSPALACLGGALKAQELPVRVLYPCLDFAALIGVHTYSQISNYNARELLGEWIFAPAAFPEAEEWFRKNADKYLDAHVPNHARKGLEKVRELAKTFVRETAEAIVRTRPLLVGCTSVFSQNNASLALLRTIKSMDPHALTIIGGANCEGEMGRELHRIFPWLDFVFSGEADVALPELARRLLDGMEKDGTGPGIYRDGFRDIPGLLAPADRGTPQAEDRSRGVVPDLSTLPEPDCDAFFQQFEAAGLGRHVAPGLAIESSRGCWWGQRQPCAFCGLNGESRHYRRKTPEQLRRDVTSLSERHGIDAFQMVDNVLATGFIEDPLRDLARRGLLFYYEVAPVLDRSGVRALHDAGIRWVQPGIEHLHDEALGALGKGSSALENLRFLKWCRQWGISCSWNLLTEIPGDRVEWYGAVARMVPWICHFEPPSAPHGSIRFDRFSQYHIHPEHYGLHLKPYPSYRHVYPESIAADEKTLSRLAYFFEDASGRERFSPEEPEWLSFKRLMREWVYVFPRIFAPNAMSRVSPILGVRHMPDGRIVLSDTRPASNHGRRELTQLEWDILSVCDDGLEPESIPWRLNARLEERRARGHAAAYDSVQTNEAINRLLERRLLLPASGKYLNLCLELPVVNYLHPKLIPGGWATPRSETCNTPDFFALTAESTYQIKPKSGTI